MDRRRPLLLAVGLVAVVVAVVLLVIATTGSSNGNASKANVAASEAATRALNNCAQNLPEWTIFLSNYSDGAADVAATFGADSPTAIWLRSEEKIFKELAATESQISAQGTLGTQAVPECVSLRSAGTPVGAIPQPPASPKDPPPTFKGRIPAS